MTSSSALVEGATMTMHALVLGCFVFFACDALTQNTRNFLGRIAASNFIVRYLQRRQTKDNVLKIQQAEKNCVETLDMPLSDCGGLATRLILCTSPSLVHGLAFNFTLQVQTVTI